MPAKLCPHCLIWVNEEQRLSGQCPACNNFFESEIPNTAATPPAFPTTSRPSQRPTIDTESTASRSNRSSGSGLWSAWWLIPLALLGMRGCSALMRTERSPPPKLDLRTPELEGFDSEFRPEGFDWRFDELDAELEGVDAEELRRLQTLLEEVERLRQIRLSNDGDEDQPYNLPDESSIETQLPTELPPE